MAEDEFPTEGMFERIPILVTAKQYDGTSKRAYEILAWVHRYDGRGYLEDGYKDQGPDLLWIKVSDGDPRQVQDKFWVVKTMDNKFQVWADDSFRRLYRVPQGVSANG